MARLFRIVVRAGQALTVLQNWASTIQANLDWLYGLSSEGQISVRLALAAVGLVVFLVGLLFLGLEVIRIRRKTVRLKDGSGDLMMNGLAEHLAYHVDMLAGVAHVKPRVVSRGKSVRIELTVETAPEVNIPAKSAEIKEKARQVMEEQLGLSVHGEVKVLIRPIAYPKVRLPAPPERPKETVPVPEVPAIEAVPKKDALPEMFEQFEPAEEESQVIEAKVPPEETSGQVG